MRNERFRPFAELRIALLLVALARLAPGLAAAQTNGAKLLAYWPFEEMRNGVITDRSGRGHDAVAYGREGRLPQIIAALIGMGLRFVEGEEQYLEVAKSEELAAPAAFTVMAWIKPQARGAAYEIIGNKADRDGAPPWPGWRFRYFWTRPVFEYGAADGTQTRLDGPAWSVPPNLWSHIAAAYDGTRLTLFVDAEKVAETPVTQPIMPSPRPLVIGNYVGRKNAYAFVGLLDELRLVEGALAEREILAYAAQGMP